MAKKCRFKNKTQAQQRAFSLLKDKQRLKSPSGDKDAQEMGFSTKADWSEEFGARSRARVRVRLFFPLWTFCSGFNLNKAKIIFGDAVIC